MMRHFKPARYIEIGSGFSSAFVLDVTERERPELQCTFIDPYPDKLHQLLTDVDWQRTRVIVDRVQNVDSALFCELEANDILFIDSSHMMKTGSDLCHEFFEILPSLQTGVLVHFHDIHYPFKYARDWVMNQKRNWNEIYALRAFLQYNSDFEILFYNAQMGVEQAAEIDRVFGFTFGISLVGCGLWLRRKLTA